MTTVHPCVCECVSCFSVCCGFPLSEWLTLGNLHSLLCDSLRFKAAKHAPSDNVALWMSLFTFGFYCSPLLLYTSFPRMPFRTQKTCLNLLRSAVVVFFNEAKKIIKKTNSVWPYPVMWLRVCIAFWVIEAKSRFRNWSVSVCAGLILYMLVKMLSCLSSVIIKHKLSGPSEGHMMIHRMKQNLMITWSFWPRRVLHI